VGSTFCGNCAFGQEFYGVVRGYLIDIPTWRQPFSELSREAFIGAAMPAMSRAPEGVAEGGRMGQRG
jgi:hypothetical protein